jgi:hypothetical protein
VVRVKILPHKTPDVALVEFETATQACIARNHLDQVQMKGKSEILQTVKGQLISKFLYWCLQFSQKMNENNST